MITESSMAIPGFLISRGTNACCAGAAAWTFWITMEGWPADAGGPVTTIPPCCCRGAVRSELQNRHRIAVCMICSPHNGHGLVVGAGGATVAPATADDTGVPHPLQKLNPSGTVCPHFVHHNLCSFSA